MAKSLTRDMHEYDTSSNDNLGENFADQFTGNILIYRFSITDVDLRLLGIP